MFSTKRFELTMKPVDGKESKVLVLNSRAYCKSINTQMKLTFRYADVSLKNLAVGEKINCTGDYNIFVYEDVAKRVFNKAWLIYGTAISIERTI